MRFNRQTLDALTLPAGKAAGFFWDDALKGFGIKVNAGGSRQWVAQYRTSDGRTPRITIGRADAVTLDEARRQARIILGKAQTGQDPHADRAAARVRDAITLGSTVETYLAQAKERLRPNSFREVERHLLKLWVPLHAMPLASIRRADVAAHLDRLIPSGRINATRSRAYVSAFFAWAVGAGLVETNPVVGVNKPSAEISRDRVLSHSELRAIWGACAADDHGTIVKLLILTGQRREEVGGMIDSEIDVRSASWTLPPLRTKNGRTHEVPLSPQASAIMAERHRIAGRNLLFGRGEGGFSGWSKAKADLDKRIAASGATVAPWRLHDLRRTAATMMAEDLAVLPHVIEAVLNHVSGHRSGVAGVYNRASYRNEKREALNRLADHVESVVRQPAAPL